MSFDEKRAQSRRGRCYTGEQMTQGLSISLYTLVVIVEAANTVTDSSGINTLMSQTTSARLLEGAPAAAEPWAV